MYTKHKKAQIEAAEASQEYGPRPTGWTMVQQALLGDQGKSYDALDIERSGKRETVYFDISDYFGKF